MFDTTGPRVFAVPLGVDFPKSLIEGLRSRLAGQPPESMARVQVILNTARMRRRVVDLFVAGPPCLLPRLSLVTDLADDPTLGLPAPVSPLRRRLELAQLISALLEAEPELAPRSALYDLADSLARLMDEMRGEGVHPDTLSSLDVSDHAAHWARTQAFLGIVSRYFDDPTEPDAETRQRLAVERLVERWKTVPPEHPVVVAGSTGSRGTTLKLMEAVAQLPQGAIVLPGYDVDMPGSVWDQMDDALTAEDHPQYRFRRLMDRLGLRPSDIDLWSPGPSFAPRRNALLSLALRPAPVTDQWLADGPGLPDLVESTSEVTLLQAPSARIEALAIALVLREAAEKGQKAALITPDRNLSRQVTAALDRWSILPDDSAGRPLALSPPGRFLRQIIGLMGEKLTSDRLLALLKHPLTASGGDRGPHLRFTRDLELTLRRYGPAFPTAESLAAWGAAQKDPGALPWALALGDALRGLETLPPQPLASIVQSHRRLAEALARGTAPEGSGALWEKAAGIEALKQMDALAADAPHGGTLTIADYRDLFGAFLSRAEVREPVQSHPDIMIWGTLEARVQGAELVILGGLNDGIWPGQPDPDPWLNRQMRKKAGLLLPERQIGLSAHDFQQAIAAPRVVLTRSTRDAEAQTVPSRWLNRLTNLMLGLPERRGPEALAAMTARGEDWLQMALALEQPSDALKQNPRMAPARRPAPQPPVKARPDRLPLTRIRELIRDPFAIYARYILGLKPLDPLNAAPDPRDRGTIFHEILEDFVRNRPEQESREAARERLLTSATEVLARETPFPAARLLWRARLERAAEHFLTQEGKHGGVPLALETQGSLPVEATGFTLFGTPDRIDRLADGRLHLIDYKTGVPPTKKMQEHFDKQLRLAAAMAERGGFADLGPSEVASFAYIGLAAGAKPEETLRKDLDLDTEWQKLVTLITRYGRRATGYTSRRAIFEDRIEGDYDHLARYGEWQMTDRAQPELVGPEDAK